MTRFRKEMGYKFGQDKYWQHKFVLQYLNDSHELIVRMKPYWPGTRLVIPCLQAKLEIEAGNLDRARKIRDAFNEAGKQGVVAFIDWMLGNIDYVMSQANLKRSKQASNN